MAKRLNFASADFSESFERLLGSKRELIDVHDTVAEIIADIRGRGDDALLAFTSNMMVWRLDLLPSWRYGDVLQAALDGLDDALRQSLELAAARIQAFHEKQRPDGFAYSDEAGVQLAMRHTPVDAVGLYVPGGKAAYPSSVLMNAIPAMVAGVERRVMVVPALNGDVNDLVLAAAARPA